MARPAAVRRGRRGATSVPTSERRGSWLRSERCASPFDAGSAVDHGFARPLERSWRQPGRTERSRPPVGTVLARDPDYSRLRSSMRRMASPNEARNRIARPGRAAGTGWLIAGWLGRRIRETDQRQDVGGRRRCSGGLGVVLGVRAALQDLLVEHPSIAGASPDEDVLEPRFIPPVSNCSEATNNRSPSARPPILKKLHPKLRPSSSRGSGTRPRYCRPTSTVTRYRDRSSSLSFGR